MSCKIFTTKKYSEYKDKIKSKKLNPKLEFIKKNCKNKDCSITIKKGI